MTVGAERRFWFNGSDCAERVQEAAQVVFRGCESHMAIDIARGIPKTTMAVPIIQCPSGSLKSGGKLTQNNVHAIWLVRYVIHSYILYVEIKLTEVMQCLPLCITSIFRCLLQEYSADDGITGSSTHVRARLQVLNLDAHKK